MNSQTTIEFRRRYKALPPAVRKKARQTYKLWKSNPAHPSLHFKRVNESKPIYSVRISLSWRALGLLKDDTVSWFWIGDHKEYDRLVG